MNRIIWSNVITGVMLCILLINPSAVAANTYGDDLTCTPNVWVENFSSLGNGTTQDNGSTGWSRDISNTNLNNDDHVEVRNKRFSFNDTDGEAVWRSEVINISAYVDLLLTVDLSASGSLEDADYIRVYYKLNGGPEKILQKGSQKNFFDPIEANTTFPLNGNTLQIVVRARNSAENEFYYFDNVRLFSSKPRIVASGGNLSCETSSVNLSASTAIPGTTYSWTGPGGFTSDAQNPGVSVAGQYTVTVNNPANGCSSSKTVEVTAFDGPEIWAESFDLADGTSNDNGATAWSTQIVPIEPVGGAGETFFDVRSKEFFVFNLDGEGIWTSETIDISNAGDVAVSLNAEGFGGLNNNPSSNQYDYFRVFYKLDGGSETSIASFEGDLPFTTITSSGNISGNTLQIVLRIKTTGLEEHYAFDNVSVFSKSLNLGLTASGGTLSCDVGSVTLTSNATLPGVTYSWTGPNGFSSGQQNPVVSNAGTYTVTAMAPNGCSESVAVEVVGPSNETQTLWYEKFAGLANGSTSDNGSTAWSIENSKGTFAVSNSKIKISNNDDEGVWRSEIINIAAQASVNATVELSSGIDNGETWENADYIKVFYKLDGGAEIPFKDGFHVGKSVNVKASANWLTGNTIQVVVRAVTTANSERYYFDRVKITANTSAGLNVTASAGGQLTCANTQVILSTNMSPVGASFNWVGPGGFSSTQATPSVSDAGYYAVTVTTDAGCSGTATVAVNQDITKPNISASGGNLACNATTINLTANTTTPGVTYAWTGPGGFTSNAQSPAVSVVGQYTVTVTNPVNGCSSSKTVAVTADEGPEIWAEFFDLADGTTTDNGTTAWSTQIVPIAPVGGAGDTFFEVRSSEFYVFNLDGEGIWTSQAIDISNAGNVTISLNGEGFGGLDGNPSSDQYDYFRVFYKLDGGAETSIASFDGDLPFTTIKSTGNIAGSTLQIVLRVKTTGLEEHYAFDDIVVRGDGASGSVDVTASVNSALTCNVSAVTLSATSPTAGVTYSWTGPGGFTSTEQNPQVSAAGDYTVTATAPGSGCEGTAQVTVVENKTAPGATGAVGGEITCTVNSVTLQGSSGTAGVTYSWIGPGTFTSSEQNPTTTVAGDYTLTVTDPSNGCTSTAQVTVIENKTAPGATAGVSGEITCSISSVTLQGSSTTAGVSYSWTGPGTFTSADQNPTATVAGDYTLTVTDPSNGCTSTAQVTVIENKTAPGATAGVSGEITCSVGSVTLQGSSTTAGVSYSWTGPGTFTSADQNPTATVAGDYTLTVTDPSNGCTSTAQVTVIENKTAPGATAGVSGEITCSVSSVTLQGSSTTAGVSYSWTGPGTFTSADQNPTVSIAGDYTLTVTDPSNGCTSTAQVTVIENKTAPGATAGVSGEITCSVGSVTLQGSSTTAGVSYSWTGPGTFTSADQNPTATVAGDYTLTVTDPSNGCTSTAQVTVIENKTAPGATADVSGEITCSVSSVTLQGSSGAAGVSYSWTGPGTFTSADQNPTATVAGDYTLTVTDLSNGCTSTAQVTVIENKTAPGATAGVSGEITCSVGSVTLQGSSGTVGVSYSWTGPGTFTSAEQNPTATVAGDYTLTVTDPSNGCTSTAQVTVIENKTAPGATAGVSGEITCSVSSVILQGSSTTAGVSYSWTGPGTFTSADQNPTVSIAGDYTLTVTDPSNGCTSTAQVTVIENKTAPGATAGVSGKITCSVNSVTLQGSSMTAGVSYSWIGPGTFTSADQNPIVTVAGDYTLTVTDPSNGCTSTAPVTVIENKTAPDATAGVSGEITCVVGNVILQGSSTTAGVSYSWIGPGTFTSADQNPTVSIAGDYTLTVTDPSNSCTSTAQVTVIENKTAPGATAGVSGDITCSVSSVTLQGSSGTAGVTYSWTGPGTFTSAEQNPTVSIAGDYTLTVTDPSNGCTSTAQVTVIENKTAPSATAGVSGGITCSVSSVTLQGSSGTVGVTYSWTGPGTFTSADQNPTVTVAGDYTLTVTDPSNGCTSTAPVTVIENKTVPGATAGVSGEITCSVSSVTLQGSSGTAGVTYSWTGPGTFTSADQNPTATVAGDYTLTVTDPSNGCTSTAQVTVIENKTAPGATADVSGEITCSVSSVTLQGSSTTAGVSYSWIGPGTFTSADQNPIVTVAGDYTLTVTDPSNGCTSTAPVTVIENKTAPDATAGVSGEITCVVGNVILQGSSTTAGVSYSWTGPGTFTSADQNPTVSIAGDYTLTVTDPSNSCTSTAQVTVIENKTAPGATAGVSGDITCSVSSVTLQGSSTTAGVTYSWTGPGTFTSADQNPAVTVAGDYTLTVTDLSNGCTSTAQVTVIENKTAPGATAGVSGEITCSVGSVTLQGSSGTVGVSYSWTGPGTFTSAEQNPTATVAGDYTLTVTDPSNGCTSTAQVTVIENKTAPGATAGVSGEITCSVSSVILQGSSTTAGVSYSWTGPGTFTSADQNPTATVAGDYTLTVTDPSNGCTSTAPVTVIENKTAPGATAGVSGEITCSVSSVTLQGSSTTAGVSYSWTGPGTFTSADQNPTVSIAGDYTLTVTDPSNGCTSTAQVTVIENKTAPDATAGVSGEITCSVSSVTLQGSSGTAGVTYSWTGPGTFTSAEQNPTVAVAGDYTLTVTDPSNGCTSTAQVTVIENKTAPGATAGVSGDITCSVSDVTLQGSSGTAGVTYSWTGPGTFTSADQNPTVSIAGDYTLTVTDPSNGCTSTAQVTVIENKTAPDATAGVSGEITCSVSSVTLQGSSTTAGVSYSWTGPGTFTSADQDPTVSIAGDYTLTVTDPSNGCTSTAQVTVIENKTTPGATAGVSGDITCSVSSVTLQGSSGTAGVTYSWTGPGTFTSADQNPTVSIAGDYTLTVTDPSNGCTSTAQVTVIENKTAPGATAGVSGNITCSVSDVTLQGSSGTAGVTYSWTGPGTFTSADQDPTVSIAGDYTLTVTDPSNGCTSTAQVTVIENKTAPGATAGVSGEITCSVSSVMLQGSSTTAGVSYSWTGPGTFTSADQNPTVSIAGDYTLTVTDPSNGCTSTAQVTVIENKTAPDITAEDAQHTCNTASTGLVLNASSTAPNAQYAWTVPPIYAGFFPDTQVQNLTVPFSFIVGDFTVMVTDPANGCGNSKTISVTDNAIAPPCDISLATGNVLNAGAIPNGAYSWTVNNTDWAITSGQGTPSIGFSPGPIGSIAEFSITITNPINGCSEGCTIELQNTSGGVVTTSSAVAFGRVASGPDVSSEEVASVGIIEIPEKASLGIYPNPFRNTATVSFMIPESAVVKIEIYSTYGVLTVPLFSGSVEANKYYEIDLSADNLTTGLYLCRLIYGKRIIEEKIMIR